ncbi:hypothetical protein C6W27_01595 [Bacillus paralicheniformis]|nr:hypothetical protein C6W27_01595 [Bacillus paralicheniformis]
MNDLNYLVEILIQKFLITTRSDNAVGTVKGEAMIYLIIGIVILATPFIWMEIVERRIQEWEKEK